MKNLVRKHYCWRQNQRWEFDGSWRINGFDGSWRINLLLFTAVSVNTKLKKSHVLFFRWLTQPRENPLWPLFSQTGACGNSGGSNISPAPNYHQCKKYTGYKTLTSPKGYGSTNIYEKSDPVGKSVIMILFFKWNWTFKPQNVGNEKAICQALYP